MTAGQETKGMTLERLAEFSDAWDAHDVERLLEFMTDDAVYSASVGPEPGETFTGKAELRKGFERMLAHDADLERRAGDAWIFGDRGVGLWSFVHTDENGREVETKGIDLFEFDGDRIKLKDAYRKTAPVS